MSRKIVMLALVAVAACGGNAPAPSAPAEPLVVKAQEEARPVEQEADTAAAAATAEPPLGKGEVVFQDFEPGNGTEDHDIYFWDYGKAAPEFDTVRYRRGSQSVKMNGDLFGFNLNKREVDVSNCQEIFLWVFDSQGANTIEIALRDMDDKQAKVWSTQKSKKNEWARISIPVNAFRAKGNVDLGRIRNVEIYEWNPGAYFFDDFGAVCGS